MKVKVLKAFDAYPKGKKTHFPVGDDVPIPAELIDECNMVNNGLIKKPNPKEA